MSRYNSPLRYPGGKQKLTPFIEEILEANYIDGNYVEPFAGGCGVGIELLINNKVDKVYFNDKDYGVFCFWDSIINSTSEFCKKVLSTPIEVREWLKQREIYQKKEIYSKFEVGFSFFFLNRCNRSGVLKGGVIGGLTQQGKYKIDARFNKPELIRRIEAIGNLADRISFSNDDALQFIQNQVNKLDNNTLVYLDPPYYVKGQDLYMNHYKHEDHVKLRSTIEEALKKLWIMSYDSADEIIAMYKDKDYFTYNLQYSASTAYKGTEVFIFDDRLIMPSYSSVKYIDDGIQNMIDSA